MNKILNVKLRLGCFPELAVGSAFRPLIQNIKLFWGTAVTEQDRTSGSSLLPSGHKALLMNPKV